MRSSGCKFRRWIAALLLCAVFFFALGAAADSVSLVQQNTLQAGTGASILAADTDLLLPLRMPVKTVLKAETAAEWHEVQGRRQHTAEQYVMMLVCFAAGLFMLHIRTVFRLISDRTDSLHRRIVTFIHRTDGKAPRGLFRNSIQ